MVGQEAPGQRVEQGGLPASRRAQQNDKLPGVEFKINVAQGEDVYLAHVVDLRQSLRLEDGRCIHG